MKFLLDANLPRSAANVLRELGHEVEDIRDVLPGGTNDAVVAARAKAGHWILVTRDFDFADIRNYPPQEYAGIVVLGLPDDSYRRAGKSGLEILCKQTGIAGETGWKIGDCRSLACSFPASLTIRGGTEISPWRKLT